MAHKKYSSEQLLTMGREYYENLSGYCQKLESEGFWTQAEKVMRQSSTEVLDLYVESELMNLAVHCGKILDNQREFILSLTKNNPLDIPKTGEIEEDVLESSKKVCSLPPILLQLCGVYDDKNQSTMTNYFLDSMINILLCMAYLNDGKNPKVSRFIQLYFDKANLFIQSDEERKQRNKRYLFKKISADKIACEVKWLEEDPFETVVPSYEAAYNAKEELLKNERNLQKKNEEKKSGRSKKGHKGDKNIKETVKKQSVEKKNTEKNMIVQDVSQNEDAHQEQQIAPIADLMTKEEEEEAREQFELVKKRIQKRQEAEEAAKEAKIKALLDELNELVGLSSVKEEIQSLINLIKIRKLREKMDMPSIDMSYHMVFTGSPGTGKTTVARLVAKIYKELGILSKGELYETDRSGLVAGYVGQTAMKVQEVVKKAMGGILFIDEAYSLVNPAIPNDFGVEAVDALVKLMEDNREDLVVIVAGYTEEMKTFLKSNTGLISRFNKFIAFPDYTKDELLAILDSMAKKAGLIIEDAAKEKVGVYLKEMTKKQWMEFGNARGIRNVFERLVMNQANRLVTVKHPDKEQLMHIIAEDIQL